MVCLLTYLKIFLNLPLYYVFHLCGSASPEIDSFTQVFIYSLRVVRIYWKRSFNEMSQSTFTGSKLPIETLEQDMKYVSKLTIKTPERRYWYNLFKQTVSRKTFQTLSILIQKLAYFNDAIVVVLVSLLLTLKHISDLVLVFLLLTLIMFLSNNLSYYCRTSGLECFFVKKGSFLCEKECPISSGTFFKQKQKKTKNSKEKS